MSTAPTSRLLWIGAIASLCFAAGCSATPTTLGRWCDEWFPGFRAEITIQSFDDGRLQALLTFSDGGTEVQNLVESANLVFFVEDSEYSDRYRILPTTGELEVIDVEGIISIARPMSSNPRADDCL